MYLDGQDQQEDVVQEGDADDFREDPSDDEVK